jgi:hypothetical protein
MKVVIALGFYDNPVLVHLQKEHSALLQNHAIMWVGTVGPHGDGDIVNFRALLFDRLELGCTEILVLACIRRGREEAYGERIAENIQWAKGRYPSASIEIKRFLFASASVEVGNEIREFLRLCPQEEVFPASLEKLEGWCNAESPRRERILILRRAVDEARNSRFEDVALVYKSLKLLTNEYWELRVNGGLDRKQKWHSGLRALGLSVAPSISPSRAGEQKNEYFVNYPVGSLPGNNKFLEQHLRKGNDRDERFCFRLYFFWDKKKNLVVVGWLPSHLDTRAT